MTIKVVNLLNSPCLLASEKGVSLSEEIKINLAKYNKVKVDFSGYKFISSTFLNNAFGQLCIELSMSKEEFNENIFIIGLDEDDEDEIELTIENAQMKRKLIDKDIDFKELSKTMIPA